MSVRKKPFEPDGIDAQAIRGIQQLLAKWGRKNYEDFPWRRTRNPFHALIAEIMLQRTKAEQVLPVYESFAKRYPSIWAAANEDPDKIRQLFQPLGLRWRTEKVLRLIRELGSKEEQIPDTPDKLIKLPGVGTYIVNAFLSTHRGVKAPIIDRNAVRLWSRIFGFNTDPETQRKKWFIKLAERMTPEEDFRQFNYAVLDFTRMICRTKPACDKCPITIHCEYFAVRRE